ncbi:hypothetical protein [Advenella mimigardefordensis]|uniref:hypothetical protein n=1 Tax=Advenella mimigardefordensis TaxID=302406 RepID=UPI00046D9182|nr:hypothetical protein [Advenella mimigardefordensis]
MNTAIQTSSCPGPASNCARSTGRLHQLLNTLRSKVYRSASVALPDPVSPDDPWATAVDQIGHLDAHVLADIGAPRWVIDEVSRRQRGDGILDISRKW